MTLRPTATKVLKGLPEDKKEGKSRGDLFILTKVSPDGYVRGSSSDALCKLGAAGALTQLKEDLRELNTSYADIVLLHWPCGHNTGTDLEPEKLAQNSEMWAAARGGTVILTKKK